MSLLGGAERLGRALLELDTDDSKLMKGIDRAGEKAKKALSGVAVDLTKTATLMTATITGPLALFGRSSLKAFQEQEQATAKMSASLKSMGPAAGFTANELERMAEALQSTSTFADEKILGDVTATLLRFDNLSGDVFKRAQQAALDLSVGLKRDLQGTALQLGKALSDPANALDALTRAGVKFAPEQQKVIESLAKTGETAKAQAMILGELERRFGGQAAAMAATTAGQMEQLSNSWNDFQEQIGQVVALALPPLSEALKGIVDWLKGLDKDTLKWIVTIGGIAAAVGPVLLSVAALVAGIGALTPVLVAVGGGILALIAATGPIGLLIAAAGLLTLAWFKWGEDAQLLFTDAFEWIALIVDQIKLYVTSAFSAMTDIMTLPFRKMVEAGQWAYDMLVGNSIIPDMVLGIEQWQGYLVSTTARHFDEMSKLMLLAAEGQLISQLDAWELMFNAFGEFSSEMLAVARVFGAASAFISALVGASKALELGFPFGLIAAGIMLAKGLALVAAIKGVSASKSSASFARPSLSSGTSGAMAAQPAEAGPAAAAAAAPAALPQAGQTMTVQGLKPDELWSGSMVRSLAEKLLQFQRNGGNVVLER